MDHVWEPCRYCKRDRWATFMVSDKYLDMYVCSQHLAKAVNVANRSDEYIRVFRIDD